MNRRNGLKSGGVWVSHVAVVALALLLGGRDLRAGDTGAGPFEYSNGLRASVFLPAA
jgi:hypothetical protein